MKAPVRDTDDLAYPEQDPSELRAQAVRERFELVRLAASNMSAAWDTYVSAAIRGPSTGAERAAVERARARLDKQIAKAEAFTLEALESAEVRVVHFTRQGRS